MYESMSYAELDLRSQGMQERVILVHLPSGNCRIKHEKPRL